MERIGMASVFVLLYVYYVFQTIQISRGMGKNIIMVLLSAASVLIAEAFDYTLAGYLLLTVILLLFALFYGEEPVTGKAVRLILPGIVLTGHAVPELFGYGTGTVVLLAVLELVLFYLLGSQRGYLKPKGGVTVTAMYVLALIVHGAAAGYGDRIFTSGRYIDMVNTGVTVYLLLLFLMQELTLRDYQIGYERNIDSFQNRLMHQQYEEIRSVYMNMRGWRHDYHNHIQVLKANLDGQQVKQARDYLNQIEAELDRVETFVRSGNMMADAILNSKLTLAEEKHIRIACDAVLTEQLFVSDIDLCIILGNILDNAIEACEKIPEEKRFLRIYMAIIKEQLYISVQNSAPEILDFEERNYISTKRGNHGLGMKRVAAVVEKREGFINLNNEPGIFGTEITIPKP